MNKAGSKSICEDDKIQSLQKKGLLHEKQESLYQKHESMHEKQESLYQKQEPHGKRQRLLKWVKMIPTTLIIWAFIVVILEVFAFNYKTYIYTSSDLKRTLEASEAVLDGLQYTGMDDLYQVTHNNPTIEYVNIDQNVKILYLDIDTTEPTDKTDVSVWYTDDTRNSYDIADAGIDGTNKTFSLLYRYEPSKYLQCNYFGDTDSMKFELTLSQGDVIHFAGVNLNQTPPLHISIARMLVLFLLFSGVFALYRAKIFRENYCPDNRQQKYVVYSIVTVFCFFIMLLFSLYAGPVTLQDFTSESGNQVSQELVDAFEKGSVSLGAVPSKELLALDNPYDITQRVASKVLYKWDHVLYNGTYYSYYGIAPVVFVFLPYHLMTGCYFPTTVLCLLSAVAGAILIAGVYMNIIKRWLSKTPFVLVIGGLIMLLFSSGVLFCVIRPSFYENAESFGFMMFAASLLLLVTSGVFTNQRLRMMNIAISTFLMGLAVLSRPTFALYAMAEVIILAIYYRDIAAKMLMRQKISYILCTLLPLMLLGLVQMIYNYMRFGSALDFGIQYSLTINDFTNTEFTFRLGFISVWSFLFSIPKVNSAFPYLHSMKDVFGLNGAYYSDTSIMTGLFVRVLPMFALCYCPKFIKQRIHSKKWSMQDVVRKILLLGLPCFIIPIIIIISTWESGHALRYNIDFGSQMFLMVVFICFTVFHEEKDSRMRKILTKIFVFATVWCMIVTMLTIMEYIPDITRPIGNSNVYSSIAYYKLAHLISFWN